MKQSAAWALNNSPFLELVERVAEPKGSQHQHEAEDGGLTPVVPIVSAGLVLAHWGVHQEGGVDAKAWDSISLWFSTSCVVVVVVFLKNCTNNQQASVRRGVWQSKQVKWSGFLAWSWSINVMLHQLCLSNLQKEIRAVALSKPALHKLIFSLILTGKS